MSTGISIVLDVGTFGINIAGTPGEIAAGAALGAAAGGLLGSVFDRSSLPVHGGPPNGSLSEEDGKGNGKIRCYDGNGDAATDYDFGHNHGAGDPHGHDWDWSKNPPRQPGRPLKPGE